MSVNAEATAGVPASTIAALMLAVFTVSVGFGVVLPILPYLIERLLGVGGEAARVSRHTGLLTAVYTLSLFLFAPMWGRLSDRRGPRGVLLVGLLGFGVTMLVFSFVESLVSVYAERFLSGVFAAAVTPVAAAVVGNLATTEEGRARLLAFGSMAGISGFLLGPMLGVSATRTAADLFTLAMPAGSAAIPLAATALLAFLVAAAVAFVVPGGGGNTRPQKKPTGAADDKTAWLVPKLLILTFFVSAGVGVFDRGASHHHRPRVHRRDQRRPHPPRGRARRERARNPGAHRAHAQGALRSRRDEGLTFDLRRWPKLAWSVSSRADVGRRAPRTVEPRRHVMRELGAAYRAEIAGAQHVEIRAVCRGSVDQREHPALSLGRVL